MIREIKVRCAACGHLTRIPTVTNADRIRASTDEELVKWIVCPKRGKIDLWACSPSIQCDDCIREWLKQEAEDEML